MTVVRIDLPVVALTLHARHVSSHTREAFADAAATISRNPRAILLRTCHRVELYLVDEEPSDRSRLELPTLPPAGGRLEGIDAVRHILELAAGLDSVVVGEDQILHQLRECLTDRQLARPDRGPNPAGAATPDQGSLHPLLQRLLQVALQLGRRTRSQREGPPRSLADVALDRIAASTGTLRERRVLIVGAGQMARLAASAASVSGAHVLISDRSHDRAVSLAHDVGGQAVAYGPREPLPSCDAILLAISGRWPLSPHTRSELVKRRIAVVDLSSPPAIDAGLRISLAARYTSVDDFAKGPVGEVPARLRHRLERTLAEAEASFVQWLRARGSVPTIRALSDQAEARRREELERLFRRTDLPAHERELVEQMSRRLVAGLLHSPIASLREDADGGLERAARSLFSL